MVALWNLRNLVRARHLGGNGLGQSEPHPRDRTEGTMQLYDPDGKFKRLDLYLHWEFSELRVNRDVVKALARWGGMSEADAKNYLSSGHGPYIRVVGDNQEAPVSEFPDVIYLNASLVDSFEAHRESSLLSTGNGKRIYAVGLGILSRIIEGHLAYYHLQKDVAKVTSILLSFEQELYGGIRWAG
jgi:hypothetical protein